MIPPYLIPVIAISFLGVIIIFLLNRYLDQKNKTNLLKKQTEWSIKFNSYKDSVLDELKDTIGSAPTYSAAIEVLIKNMSSFIPNSSVCALIHEDGRLNFRTSVNEPVGHAFIDNIKNILMEKMSNENPHLSTTIKENITGEKFDDVSSSPMASYYEIMLKPNTETIGFISIASTSEGLYAQPTEMDEVKKSTENIISFINKLKILIQDEKNRTRGLVNSFTDGVFIVNNQKALIQINQSAKKILGIDKDVPTLSDIISVLPNTYNFEEKINLAITENKKYEKDDIPVKDTVLKITIIPTGLPASSPIGASVLIHDSTAEKTLSKMRDDFISIMVHELRSPLTAIRASSKLLTSEARLTDEEKSKLISMISDSSDKMLLKISLILDSAKLDAGLFSIRKTQSDLKKLIDDRINIFTPAAKEKSVNINTEIIGTIPEFLFDPSRVDEVINNLLSNSLKFTPEKGTIRIIAKRDDHRVEVAVSDNGAGIPKDKQGQLFSKFAQVVGANSSKGTGLGLYVVKGVVEAHGGSVQLASEEGQGTTISFTLPLEGAVVSAENPDQSENPQLSGRIIN